MQQNTSIDHHISIAACAGAPGPGASTMRLLSSRCNADAAACGGAAPLPLLFPELPPPQLPGDISVCTHPDAHAPARALTHLQAC